MSKLFQDTQYASEMFKALSNKDRLVILSGLLKGEMKVGEMESVFGIQQPTLSQQLARLRSARLVKTRRVSKEIFYSLASVDAKLMLEWLSGNSKR